MAVESSIIYKDIPIEKAYIRFKSIFTDTIDGGETNDDGSITLSKQYISIVKVQVFKDSTKVTHLEDDTIMYFDTNMSEITIERMWKEIKKKYQGTDIL